MKGTSYAFKGNYSRNLQICISADAVLWIYYDITTYVITDHMKVMCFASKAQKAVEE